MRTTKPKFKKSKPRPEAVKIVEPFELSSSMIIALITGLVNLGAIIGYLAVKMGAAPDTGWLIILPFLACITSAPLGIIFGTISTFQCAKYFKASGDVMAARIGILTALEVTLSLGMLILISGSLANVFG